MASAWGDPYEGRATTFVRWVGGATIIVSVTARNDAGETQPVSVTVLVP